MHVCLTIKYYKIMGGDKIVLLDGAGANGGGAATNGLLSMIPGMFANLIGGNKMDPNLVADVAEVVLIEEQTQRIQLIRNM